MQGHWNAKGLLQIEQKIVAFMGKLNLKHVLSERLSTLRDPVLTVIFWSNQLTNSTSTVTYRSLKAIVPLPKNCPFVVNTVELKKITASDNNGI